MAVLQQAGFAGWDQLGSQQERCVWEKMMAKTVLRDGRQQEDYPGEEVGSAESKSRVRRLDK